MSSSSSLGGLPRIQIPAAPRLSARARGRYRPVKTLQRRGATAVFAVQELDPGSPAVVKVSPAESAATRRQCIAG